MRHLLLLTTITICSAALTAAAAQAATTATARPEASRGGPPCTPKVTKLAGHQAVVNCGPATATVRIGGKTYTFRNGFCQQSKSAGMVLQLDLGTTAPSAKGNAGLPHFNIDVIKHRLTATVDADYRGKSLATSALVAVSGKVPARGTFKSKFSGPGFGASFTGSWDCHGVVWQAP
jgi:hypothetical protein